MKMLLCKISDGFSVEFTLPVRAGKWHQLNFRPLRSEEIPLHLSLRPAERTAVISTFRKAVWSEPETLPLPLDDAGSLQVALRFGAEGLVLAINGQTLGALSPERYEFDLVDWLELPPDAEFGTLVLNGEQCPRIAVPELKFGEDLMVYGYDLPLRSDEAGVSLEVEGTGITLPCAREAPATGSSPLSALQAVWPGFLWAVQGAGEQLSAKIAPPHAFADLPEFTLTKSQVLATIEALARRCPDPLQSRFEAISALEHVKYGMLLPRLSQEGQDYIRRATESYQLEDFMALPEADQSPVPQPVPAAPQSIEAALAAEWKSEVSDLLSAADECEHGVVFSAAARRLPPVGPDSLESLLLSFTEHFCRIGQFEALYAEWLLAGANGGPEFTAPDGASLSQSLPYLAKQGAFDQLAAGLEALADRTQDWLNTAAIAWSVRSVLHSPTATLRAEQMQRVIRAALQLCERMSEPYWGRGPCRNMISVQVSLLEAAPRLPGWAARDIERSALRCYGFSPNFWQQLTLTVPEFAERSLLLSQGQAAFEAIRSHAEARAAGRAGHHGLLQSALRFFDSLKAFDTERMRVELLGPADLLTENDEAEFRESQSGAFHGDLIRRLAFPGAPALPERFHAVARQAVRGLRQPDRISGSHEQVQELTRLAVTLLRPGAAEVSAEQIKALEVRLLSLPEEHAPHLRLNVALLIYCDALRLGQSALRFVLEPLISRLMALKPELTPDDPVLAAVAARLTALSAGAPSPTFIGALLSQLNACLSAPLRAAEFPPQWRERWLQTSALFDTLVLIYSCRRNLETRVARIRETWMRDLEALGIPCLIVVGDGDGSLQSDLLRLKADDTYEALPAKTLDMIRWAAETTPFSHILKIDDDCYLDAEEYFLSLSHRCHDYYGRVIRRAAGKKPSAWHMTRSKTLRARMELDKSPEPSTYTDGGSGYALSRKSLLAATRHAGSGAGQRLRSVSYSEDKLVGDLLAMEGISPKEKDCNATLLRRVHDQGIPVLRWSAGFFPSVISGTKIAHLDSCDASADIRAQHSQGRLTPPMIWPANRAVRLDHVSPHMVLVSPAERLQQAIDAEVAVISVVRNEKFSLGHFLDHYRRLGVRAFLFVDNLSDDGTLEFLLGQPDTTVFTAEAPFRSTAQGTEWKIALMAQLRPGRWSLVADADEFLVYENSSQTLLADYLSRPEFAGSDAFAVSMLDLYPQDRLEKARLEATDPFSQISFADRKALLHAPTYSGPFGDVVARTSALRHRILPGSGRELFVAEKVPLIKYQPWMRFSLSLHYATEVKQAPKQLMFAHFKYHAEFLNRARREVKRGQYYNNAQEYKRYLALLSEARDVLYEEGVSVPWEECDLAREVLGTG